MEQNEPFYGSENENDQLEQGDNERSAVLRKQKVRARRAQSAEKTTGRTVQTAGRATQTAGVATQATGKAVKYSGKAVDYAGRGVKAGGQAMTRAGTALSETGLGAIIGVPLAAIGGVTTAAGAGTEAVGKGVAKVGEGVDNTGKQIKNTGKRINKVGKDLKKRGQNRPRNIKDIESKGVSMVFNRMTDMLLRSAWIYALPSFGLTLFYIHIHAFFSLALGKEYFCPLGHEWASMSLTKGIPTGGKMSKLIKKQVDELGDKVGFAEWFVLISLDLLALFVFFIVIAQFAFWVSVIEKITDFFPDGLLDEILTWIA